MEIYLIRHTSIAVEKGFIYGRTDVSLSEDFSKEKLKVLSQLPGNLDRVYSSPSTRCTLLAAEISREYIIDERLYELNFGLWEGKNWNTLDPNNSQFWMEDYINRCPPEGESMNQMSERVIEFWNEISELRLKKIAIVTHGGVIRIILTLLRKIDLKSSFDISIKFGEVFKLESLQHE